MRAAALAGGFLAVALAAVACINAARLLFPPLSPPPLTERPCPACPEMAAPAPACPFRAEDLIAPDQPGAALSCQEFGLVPAARPRRVIDAFLFYREHEMFALRLLELSGIVDRFLLLESPATFAGTRRKPLYYERLKECYARWDGSIVHGIADALPRSVEGAWAAEHHLRDSLGRKALELYDRDPLLRATPQEDVLVVIGDADEIPSYEAVWAAKHCDGYRPPVRVNLQFFYYNFRWFKQNWLAGPCIAALSLCSTAR